MGNANVKYTSQLEDYKTIEPQPVPTEEDFMAKYGYAYPALDLPPEVAPFYQEAIDNPKIAAGAGTVPQQATTQPTIQNPVQAQAVAPQTPSQAQLPQKTARELILEAYERRLTQEAPKPTFDPTAPDYYKRAAKYNAIGKGLSTLADAFSLARGGSVNAPVQDNKIPSYINQHFKYLDDYRDKVDKYDMMNYQNKLRLDEMKLGDATQQENMAARADQYNKGLQHDKDMAEAKMKFDTEKGNVDFEREKELMGDKFDNEQKLMGIKSASDMALQKQKFLGNIAQYEAKARFDGKNFGLYDNNGNNVALLKPGESEKILSLILSDPSTKALAESDIKLMKAEFGEGLSKQAIQTIIGSYWQESEMVKKYLNENKPVEVPESAKSYLEYLQGGSTKPEEQTKEKAKPVVKLEKGSLDNL